MFDIFVVQAMRFVLLCTKVLKLKFIMAMCLDLRSPRMMNVSANKFQALRVFQMLLPVCFENIFVKYLCLCMYQSFVLHRTVC